MSLWIKVCGNTSYEDAQMSADAGADALGFVFAPSSRQVTIEQVAAIIPRLSARVEKIGVFVDASFQEITSTVERSGLTGIQLHFGAPRELPIKLRARLGPKMRILRVVHYDGGGAIAAFNNDAARTVDAVLIDSRTSSAVGGTGISYDWTAVRETFLKQGELYRLVVAGGLNPVNVAKAIATLKPWGVDVVSGVEAAPGRKDANKVKTFIANARVASGDSTL